MKTINLTQQHLDIAQVLELARHEPIVVIALGGREFIVAETDDFETEVSQLRASSEFQHFLDERIARRNHRRPLRAVLDEIEQELAQNTANDEAV